MKRLKDFRAGFVLSAVVAAFLISGLRANAEFVCTNQAVGYSGTAWSIRIAKGPDPKQESYIASIWEYPGQSKDQALAAYAVGVKPVDGRLIIEDISGESWFLLTLDPKSKEGVFESYTSKEGVISDKVKCAGILGNRI